jgi:hypothetical protein
MASIAIALNCPHCDAEIEVLVQADVQLVPPLRLHFATADELAAWLKASNLSVEEFERLPAYRLHRDHFEPLLKSLGVEATAGVEADEDSPITRAQVPVSRRR